MNDESVLPPGSQNRNDRAIPLDTVRGSVVLDRTTLLLLRRGRFLSQQDLADDCWRRNVAVSLPTIKRAELERPVRYRIARVLAGYYGVEVASLLKP